MFDVSLFQRISTARLEQWGVLEADRICVRVDGGREEVRLAPSEWAEILDRYHRTVDESARRLRWSMILALPFSISLIFLLMSIPGAREATRWIDEKANFLGFVLVFIIMSGLPLTAIILHGRAVMKALDRARRRLRKLERHPARHRAPTSEATPLERVAAFAAIPYLIIEIYGSYDPDAYRNTPWTGTRLDFGGLVCIAVLVGLGWRRWRAVQLARAEGPTEPPVRSNDPGPRTFGRRVDPIARARDAAS